MHGGTLWAERYRVIRRLGSGGMATVWAGEDERLGRTVAIKRLHVPGGAHRRRFEREARLGASLRHPALVTVYDVVPADTELLLVMEHVDGGSLAARLEHGPLPPAEAVRVLRDVAGALDHAHAHGVLHRDVKPANILLGRDGRARLADLGIATALDHTRMTADGDLLGTPAYLAPEQVDGAPATGASDVYALAAVAFEALSGRRAHDGDAALQVMYRIRNDPAPDLRTAWPDAPPAAAGVLRAAMSPRPEDRPACAGDLVDDLERALTAAPAPVTEPTRAMPVAAPSPPRRRASAPRAPSGPPPRRSRRPALLAAAALVAVAAAVVAV